MFSVHLCLKLVNGTGEEKVQTLHQTVLTILPCEYATHMKNVHYILRISSFACGI